MEKAKDYIGWDIYFMSVAKLSALRSKDPSTGVGACIVDPSNRILGIGYNGLPNGCNDDDFPWAREGDVLETKYPYVIHAEQNAIMNATRRLTGCTIYVSLFPCNECAKLIIQSGITRVVYEDDKYKDSDNNKASRRLFEAAGIELVKSEKKTDLILTIDENRR